MRCVRYRDRRRDEGEPIFLKEARRHECKLPPEGQGGRIAAHAERVAAELATIEAGRVRSRHWHARRAAP